MLNTYQQWNRTSARWLWAVVLVAVLAALPMIGGRYQTETTPGSDTVEFVFDYRDLIEMSAYQPDPKKYRNEQLARMKELGIGSMAIYESTLEEWSNSGHIQLFTQQEALTLTGVGSSSAVQPGRNRTYLLFADAATQRALEPLLQDTFRDRLQVGMQTWSLDGRSGYILDMAYDDALIKPMRPDPLTIEELKRAGFQIIPRMSNRMQPFDVERVKAMVEEFQQLGVKRVVFDGAEVTGYSDDPDDKEFLPQVAALLKKADIGIAAIELLKAQQKGFNTLAHQTDYNAVRLTSIYEKDASLSPERLSDRIVLAVKDRNIRMVFLNSRVAKDADKGVYTDYLEDNLYEALTGPDGAVQRLESAGFKLGVAQPLEPHAAPMAKLLKVLVMIGVAALGALLIGEYFPLLRLAAFIAVMAGTAVLTVLSSSLALSAMALVAGISAPTLAVVRLVRWTEERRAAGMRGNVGVALWKLVQSLALTLVGISFMVGLLDDIQYSLLLQQYRGVSIHHLAPILLVALYVLVFREDRSLSGIGSRILSLLTLRLSVWMLVLAAVGGAAVMYYLSRTGNEGQVSALEMLFRTVLEDVFGARPRNKELLGHPMLLLGVLLALRYRWGSVLLIGGVVGQLSVSGTFAHYHTPLLMSLLRVFNGVWLGVIIGLLLIAVWNVGRKGWQRWAK